MSRRQHQFPAMREERIEEIHGLLTKMAKLDLDTRVADELIAEVERLREMASIEKPTSIIYKLRFGGGIGTDGTNGCFVCGVPDTCENMATKNISGFVESKALGFHAVEWFGGAGARLDHRYWEPQWLQLKVGTCVEHVPYLEKLVELITSHQNLLTPGFIERARQAAPAAPDAGRPEEQANG